MKQQDDKVWKQIGRAGKIPNTVKAAPLYKTPPSHFGDQIL